MKESIWYSAAHDEIWIRHGRKQIERGCQGVNVYEGQLVSDYLSLFYWTVNLKKWARHLKAGWLVKLEEK